MMSFSKVKSSFLGYTTTVALTLLDGGNKAIKSLSGVNSYILGLVISVVLTLLAYVLVTFHVSGSFLVMLSLLLFLAILQLIAQLIFFLHVGQESTPKLNVIFFVTTFVVILAVVVSSIWIIVNLNYRMPR